MNKIFKVIWSKARNCYVVVSELAKSHDDGHVRRSRSECCRKAAVLAAWVLTMGVNGAALAADMPKTYTKDNVKYTLSRVSGLTGVYYDSGKTKYALITYSDNNYNDKTTKTVTINDIAYDTTSTHDYSVNSSGEKSTDDGAIIDSNYTNTGAIGTGALAAGVNALAVGTNSVAIGTGATAAGNGATVIGQYASASGQYATAFGGLKTRNSNNEVIYYRNEANGDASVAFGEGTKANGEASLAFGHNTIAGARGGGQQSVAFGESTKALGGRSLAFGENTMAEFNDSVAFGNASRALSTGSLAHGNRTNAVGQYSTSWGNNTVAAGENATVFGTDAMAGAIDENGAIIITDNNNRPVKIDKNGYKAFIDTNGKTQSVTYTVTKGEIHKYLVLTDANNQKKYICDYHGDIHELYYVDDKGIVQNASGSLATSNIEKIDPGSNGYLIKNQKNATAFGNATRATAAESTAWGQESIASGEASTAFGIGSKAEGKNSLAALGGLSANENSIAIGQGTKANNDEEFVSAAIGQNAVASGKKSLALGFAGENAETSSTVASGENALALGTGAQALAKNSISIGAGNKVSGKGSGAIGDPTDITGTGSYELGNGNGKYTENAYTDTSFNANNSGIFGNENTVHGDTADSPLANIRVVGNNNTVTASNALVLGNHSTVPATGGIAIGNSVKSGVGQYNTLGSNTTAIGNESQAYHDNAVAIGTKSKATGSGSIAIGDEASTLSNQGEEKQPTDAIAIGTKAKVERGNSSIAIGKNADILADGENTQNNIAIGTDTYIRHGSSSVVMGNAAKDYSDAGSSIVLGNGANVAQSVISNGIAIGTQAEVANTNGGVAIGNGAKATNSNGGDGSPVAVGQSAEATGTQAVAIGYNAKANNNQVGQTVVGSTARATANYGTIIGYGATGTNTQADQTAIGHLATTNAAGGVALGANSNSDRPYDSTSATSPYIPTGASDEQTNRINATKATTGAVSVGYTDSSGSSKNVRRQIINVAAGEEDTDAVNVAQLKAVQSQSASQTLVYKANNGTNGSGSVKLSDGLNFTNGTNTTATVGENGVVTFDIADSTIQDKARKAVVVEAGNNNVTVTPVKDETNHTTTYKVSATHNKLDTATYTNSTDTSDAASLVLKDADNNTTTIDMKNTYTTVTKNATDKTVTFARNDGQTQTVSLSDLGGSAHDYQLVGSDGNAGNGETNKYTVSNGKVTLKVKDTAVANGAVQNVVIDGIASTTDLANQKLNFGANAGETDITKKVVSNSLNSTVNIVGKEAKTDHTYSADNLTTTVEQANDGTTTITVKMDDDITSNTVTVGKDGAPGKDGVDGKVVIKNGKDGKDGADAGIHVIKGNPGVDGKDGETITRVVYNDGTDGKNGKDHTFATLEDDGLNFVGDDGKKVSKKLNDTLDVVGNSGDKKLTDKNIGVVNENNKLVIKLAENIDLGKDGSVTMGNTVINNNGIKITNTAEGKSDVIINGNTISMGGNKVTNVADGIISKESKEAVNGSQLYQVQQTAEAHTTVSVGGKSGIENTEVTGGNLIMKQTTANGAKNFDVKLADDLNVNSVTTKDEAGNTTVQNGSGITTTDKDGNTSEFTANGVETTDTSGNTSNLTSTDLTFSDNTEGGNTTTVSKDGVNINNGDVTLNDAGLTIKDGPSVTKDGINAGNKQITNVASGINGKAYDTTVEGQENWNNAANIGDIQTITKAATDVVEQHHTAVTVNGGTGAPDAGADGQYGSYTGGNLQLAQKNEDGKITYDLKLADNLNIGGKNGEDGVDGHIGINGADGKSGVGIDGKDGISIKGADGKDGVTIKGVVGKDGTEGHIGLTGAKGADGKNAAADIHVKNGQVGVDGTHGGKDGMDRVAYEDHNHITHEVATMDDGMKYSGDSGNAAVKLNKNVQIYGGATEYADGNNIGVVASQDGDNAKLQVKLAKDLKGLDSVTTGDTTINNSGLTVKGDDNHKAITIQQGNVNMGGNTISGVADGKVSKDSTDAVNGSQLWQRDQAINGLSGSVNKLGNRINRVGAGAAALAALHPLDFDPDDKWDFAAGYGNYRGANAAAVGAYYRPNEDTMFSVGGSFGGGENMVNAGVSIKLGQGNHVSTSRVAMAKEMKAMRQHMAEQDALIAKLQSMHGMAVDPAKSVLFPDVAENHWAYQYVTTLAKKGILEGYPDGEFKGDRMMTRYEFAAIVYRIVESGVGSTDPELSKLVKEFSPELQYIRIDTIQKDRNGKPTIERVRVISDAK